jgi:hypothetical protein
MWPTQAGNAALARNRKWRLDDRCCGFYFAPCRSVHPRPFLDESVLSQPLLPRMLTNPRTV